MCRGLGVLLTGLVLSVPPSYGGQVDRASAEPRSGRQVYESICTTCHGPDGRGANIELAKVVPLPNFADCEFAVREPDVDWLAVAHGGGPARGFSPIMPPWASVYTTEELTLAIGHVRTFCKDERWPRGELNLPRPLVTGKAFPEDEAVVTLSAATEDAGHVVSTFVYERRVGPLNQIEIAVPLAAAEASGRWSRGVGDVALGYKRTLAHSLARGSIFSISGEVVLPTGRESRGLGAGVAVFEPFVTFGQILPRRTFLQAQAGFEIPASRDRESEAFWRAAVGKSFVQGRFGRTWSPMMEVLAARPLERGAAIDWDVVPQMQVTLSARQHIMLSGGVRLPVTDRDRRPARLLVYLLWDWYDGGFFTGW